MRQVIVLTAGLIVGVVLSGMGAALVVPLVPEGWRGGALIWTLTAVITVLTMTIFSVVSTRSQK